MQTSPFGLISNGIFAFSRVLVHWQLCVRHANANNRVCSWNKCESTRICPLCDTIQTAEAKAAAPPPPLPSPPDNSSAKLISWQEEPAELTFSVPCLDWNPVMLKSVIHHVSQTVGRPDRQRLFYLQKVWNIVSFDFTVQSLRETAAIPTYPYSAPSQQSNAEVEWAVSRTAGRERLSFADWASPLSPFRHPPRRRHRTSWSQSASLSLVNNHQLYARIRWQNCNIASLTGFFSKPQGRKKVISPLFFWSVWMILTAAARFLKNNSSRETHVADAWPSSDEIFTLFAETENTNSQKEEIVVSFPGSSKNGSGMTFGCHRRDAGKLRETILQQAGWPVWRTQRWRQWQHNTGRVVCPCHRNHVCLASVGCSELQAPFVVQLSLSVLRENIPSKSRARYVKIYNKWDVQTCKAEKWRNQAHLALSILGTWRSSTSLFPGTFKSCAVRSWLWGDPQCVTGRSNQKGESFLKLMGMGVTLVWRP